MQFPDQGELFPAKNKKFKELVFFVHFYDGSKQKIQKHVDLVNELGFDAFSFKLQDQISLFDLPLNPNLTFGVQHRIANQVEKLLNLFPQKKIVFSFSAPSAGAIEAISRRNASDIAALICDSGPSGEFVKSIYNLLEHLYGYSIPRRLLYWPVLCFGWSLNLQRDVRGFLQSLPRGFKILSIRGWKDKLISPDDIDKVFDGMNHLDWKKHSLPEAEHLAGLKDFRKDYIPPVENFLNEVATPIA